MFLEGRSGRGEPGRIVLRILLLCLIGVPVVTAQLPTATILGVVKDSSGAVVPNATLTARNIETGQTRTAVTEAGGSYRFSALPVGPYEVTTEMSGFKSAVRRGFTLTVAQEAVVNFTLEVGAVVERIEVQAEAPVVNTTSGSLGSLVNEQKVADLPLNGRNYINLTLLQPGVTEHRNYNHLASFIGTWFSSNGAPVRSNNFLLDGASMVTILGAASGSVIGTTLGVEGIREYQVVTNSFSAEYGMTMGSQTLIVSKSGTNNFHGSLFEYLRNSALDARNFFDRKSAANNRRLPVFARNNFGGSLGGPIHKDKTFIHAAYEGVRERLGVTNLLNVIPAAVKVDGVLVPQIAPVMKPLLALFPDPNLPNNQYTFAASQRTSENYGHARVDQTFSKNDNLFARYTIQDTSRASPREYPQFRDFIASRNQYGTLSENHIFSPALLNTFRYSYSRTVLTMFSTSEITKPEFVLGRGLGWIDIGGVSRFWPDPNTPIDQRQNIFTWSDDLFYFRGRHSWKFGTLINRYQQYFLYNQSAPGRAAFANISQFLLGRPIILNALAPGSITDRTYHFTTFGFYVSDDMRVGSNLTLNLGLRYEFMTQPQEVRGRGAALRDIRHDAATTLGPPFENPSLRNFSPRFGFAWDIRGDGKTALRGGFGLLYDVGNVGTSLFQAAAGTPPFSRQSSVLYPSGVIPPTLTLPFSFPTPGDALLGIDYHLQQPHMLHYNLTLERELPFAMGLRLAYGGSRGINLMKQTEGNPTVPQVLSDGRSFWTGTDPRTNPNWSNFSMQTASANSWYNSLQFLLTKRLSQGLQFESSYTWSKLIDETQGQAPADSGTPTGSQVSDPSHRTVDRGVASFDVPHNWKFNAIYHLPGTSLAGVAGKVFSGWWVSGILSVQSGTPFSPTLAGNRSRSRAAGAVRDRPDLVPGRKISDIILGGPVRYFDPSAFSIQPAGFLGTAGRNILRAPGLANLDFTLTKDTSVRFLGEAGKLEFRAEIFNILNHTNFGPPDPYVFAGISNVESPLPSVGSITATATTSRQIQLALKIVF